MSTDCIEGDGEEEYPLLGRSYSRPGIIFS
jgi:hypothetical protein